MLHTQFATRHVTNVHSRVFRTRWRSCERARRRRSCAHRFLHSAHDAGCSISNRLSKLQGVGEKVRHSVQICCVTGHAPRYGRSTRLTAAGADSAVASASGVLGDWLMTRHDDSDAESLPPTPIPDPCRLLIRARRAARMGSVEQSVRRRRDTHQNAVDMVVLHRDTTAGHASA